MYFSIAPEEFSFKFLSFKIPNFVQYLDVSRQMNSNVSSLRFAQGGELHIWIFPRNPFWESTAPGRGEGKKPVYLSRLSLSTLGALVLLPQPQLQDGVCNRLFAQRSAVKWEDGKGSSCICL